MVKKARFNADYVATLWNHKRNTKRDVVINVETQVAAIKDLYSFYIAALSATEDKCNADEIVVRVSRKGFS